MTYEAAACGLPCIVSPMGAARIVRGGIEGYVIDPFDGDGWISAMKNLAANPDFRKRFGAASAAQAAEEFTWQKVGARLHDLFSSLPVPEGKSP